MMQKTFLCAAIALLLGLPARVEAQVIQIDDDGEATTYDQPTIFTAEDASPIQLRDAAEGGADTAKTLVARAARAHGLDPRLLEAVAWQESRGHADAVSTKGARGVMQLMPSTAAELGVRIDDVTDNIRGGAMYLRQQLDRFGSVPLALAAYNAGPGAVLRYGGVPPYRETRNYVSTIMARWHSAAVRTAPVQPSSEVVQP